MVVTCYSRTCSRPELPVSSAARCASRVCVRIHAYQRDDTVHERARLGNKREHIRVPSVNGYVAFFDVSVSPPNGNEGDDDGEVEEEHHDDDDDDNHDDEQRREMLALSRLSFFLFLFYYLFFPTFPHFCLYSP